ncbi:MULTISPECIES: hypothetical protein [Pseudonocardia]|uniref:hypothetical protein n=1 Tax=Pseudonocardia TaxID=1847 RepID=UPI00307D8C00
MTTPQSPYQGHPQQQPYYGQYPPQQGGQYPPQGYPPPQGQYPQYNQAPQIPPPAPKKKRTGLKVTLGILVAIVVIAIATGGGGDEQAPAAASGDANAAPAAAGAAASGDQSVKFGQEATSGDLAISASAPEQVTEFGMTQACSTVTYKNNGSSPASFNPFDWKFTTPAGVEASASIPFNAGAKALNSGQLAPGGTTSGMICGDQQTTDVNAVKYAPSFSFSDPITWTN